MASLTRRLLSNPSRYQCLSKYSAMRFTSGQQQLHKPDEPKTELRHLLKVSDLSKPEMLDLVNGCAAIKSSPISAYNKTLENKSLLMLFEITKSLRTRVSFEVSMEQLGGHAIFYSIEHSPLGQKETFGDTGLYTHTYYPSEFRLCAYF